MIHVIVIVIVSSLAATIILQAMIYATVNDAFVPRETDTCINISCENWLFKSTCNLARKVMHRIILCMY